MSSVVYATAEMLWLRRSRLRQSNPSILTAAGLWLNFILTHPPPIRDDGDRGDGIGEEGVNFSFPNCASRITGFEVLVGGDPLKKGGGDEAT